MAGERNPARYGETWLQYRIDAYPPSTPVRRGLGDFPAFPSYFRTISSGGLL